MHTRFGFGLVIALVGCGGVVTFEPGPLAAVSPTEVYVSNAIIGIETGKTVWQGPQGATSGAVAGGMVVYSQDHRLVLEAR